MGCPVEWERVSEPVADRPDVTRHFYRRKRTVEPVKQLLDVPPDPCEGYVYPPGDAPTGMTPYTGTDGAVEWLVPGDAGDYYRLSVNGIPYWSPA